jgi:hypothetical protein
MYAITTAAFIGFVIILGSSRARRTRTDPRSADSGDSGRKERYTSDGRRITE